MTLVNRGFDGKVNEADFSRMQAILGAEGVDGAAAWAVTQGTGRQVSVAASAGYAAAAGVVSKDDAGPILAALSTPASGQWFLIVRRIDWSSHTVTVVVIAHTTTSTTIPTLPPTTYPTMSSTAGTQYDQPLAWAWARSSDTTVAIFDLRKLPLKTRLVTLEAALVSNGADLDALVLLDPAAYESRFVNVDELNADFQAQDGVWVQTTAARFASASTRDTAYAKGSAAFKVVGAEVLRTDKVYREKWNGTAWQPFGVTKVVSQALATATIPTTAADVASSSFTFTVDANTSARVLFQFGGRLSTPGVATVTLSLNIDGTDVRTFAIANGGGSLFQAEGGEKWVQSLAAGSHTIKLRNGTNASTPSLANGYLMLTFLDLDPSL